MIKKGKVVKILDVETGTSKSGKEWQKQTFVIDSEEQYNNILAVEVFGDKVQLLNSLKIGDEVEVEVNVSSREYNGKYYHNVSLWKIATLSSEPKQELNSSGLDLPFEDDDLPY